MSWSDMIVTIHDTLSSVFPLGHAVGVYDAPSGLVRDCRVAIERNVTRYPAGLAAQAVEGATVITLYRSEIAEPERGATIIVLGKCYRLDLPLDEDRDNSYDHRWIVKEVD